jgi:hypothetical protein
LQVTHLISFSLADGLSCIGTAIRKVYSKVADLDDPKTWARVVEERARVFEKEMPIAFNNLAIAQHRDTLHYAHTRSGDYKLKKV